MFERFLIFTKPQVSSFTGSTADYFLVIFITEVFHLYYSLSIAIGDIFGATSQIRYRLCK